MSFELSKDVEKALWEANNYETMRATLHGAILSTPGIKMAHSWDEQNIQPVNTVKDRDARGRFLSEDQPQQEFKRVATINGRALEFRAESPEMLDTLIEQAQQVANALKTDSSAASTAAINRHSQKANDLQVARQTDLELKFKRGEISTQQYLEQSGAIEEYMASHGAPLEQIVQTVREAQAQQETQSWMEAVDVFLHSFADWPGGNRNRDLLGMTIANLGLASTEDKFAALTQSYSYLKERGMLFQPDQDVQAAREIASMQDQMAQANSPSEIRLALENYKSGVAASGQDPNEAFVKTFGRSGADTKYSPVVPSGERRSSGLFGR